MGARCGNRGGQKYKGEEGCGGLDHWFLLLKLFDRCFCGKFIHTFLVVDLISWDRFLLGRERTRESSK